MIKGKPARVGVVLLDAGGQPVSGVTPSVEIKIDADVWKATTNAASQSDAKGRSDVLLDAGEMTGASLQIYWQPPSTEFVVLHQTAQILDPADIAAAILATPANKLATSAAGEVTTDAASRTASQADLTGVSTFDPASDEVTTDAASRTASQADVSALAVQTELDKVPKKGLQTWEHGSGETADVTINQT